jgi:hypothetical protein
MAALMDDDEVAGRQRGQIEDECNNQIVVDCVRGKRALNNTMSGGDGQRKASGRWTTQEGAVDDARQVGRGQHGGSRWQATQGNVAVDDKTREGGWRVRCGDIGRWMTKQVRRRQGRSLSCRALGTEDNKKNWKAGEKTTDNVLLDLLRG